MDVLYLVRHGETEWNRQRRMQGRLDSPLTPEGRAHARMNGQLLARETVGQMIVSPLGRTRETAELILEGCDIPVTYDARLVERHCGEWEGLTIDEIADQYPDEWAARSLDPFHHRPPAGENLPDMLLRIAPAAPGGGGVGGFLTDSGAATLWVAWSAETRTVRAAAEGWDG